MPREYILQIKPNKHHPNAGNKARMLGFLCAHNFLVPPAYICVWDAFQKYQSGDSDILVNLRNEISKKLNNQKYYAVRSSANLEDESVQSFAGQFKTVLNVQGEDDILKAILVVWKSSQARGAENYRKNTVDSREQVQMAVIIQEMVDVQISGVSFSKNPVTGLDEVVVEAVTGSGDQLVQQGVTPVRWVNKWGEWIEKTSNPDIADDLIQKVVDGTKEISSIYGNPVDLEWVFDGKNIYWVQLREITELKNLNIYSNRISREVLPGMIKPLVWSINIPLVNSAWICIFTELIGKNDIDPKSLAKSFYYRAYFNMGVIGKIFKLLGIPEESLELLMGIKSGGEEKPSFKPTLKTYRHVPRMLVFAVKKWRIGGKFRKFHAEKWEEYNAFHDARLDQLNDEQILKSIGKLYEETLETAYYNIVIPLLMQFYNQLLKSYLKKSGVEYEDFDVTENLTELHEYDPNFCLENLHHQYQNLNVQNKELLKSNDSESFRKMEDIENFRQGVQLFIKRFGHFSDSGNDFSVEPWRENIELILKMIIHYSPQKRDSPGKITYHQLQIPFFRKLIFKSIFRRARQFRLFREQISSLYTFGYGLFRRYFLELATRFVDRAWISERNEIFYLDMKDIVSVVKNQNMSSDLKQTIKRRKTEMTEFADVSLPETIYGDDPPPLKADRGCERKGVATSRGYYQGPARIVRGMSDFDKIKQGDVLIVPYSDVGWTPLFSKAGAVVAESGGMLSHSSIIAREFGIPAVVSVAGACNLKDDTIIAVDGFNGIIIIPN
ncbi:hypothetical protein GF337_19780 [candidate division KSB1 bacterium]|nr:hypothetical protein [candidate division KSB1 bacterium]